MIQSCVLAVTHVFSLPGRLCLKMYSHSCLVDQCVSLPPSAKSFTLIFARQPTVG